MATSRATPKAMYIVARSRMKCSLNAPIRARRKKLDGEAASQTPAPI